MKENEMPNPNWYLRTDAERGREAKGCLGLIGAVVLLVVAVCVVINLATGIW